MTDLSWLQGAMLTMGMLVVVAVAAQCVNEDRREQRKRRELRRAAQLERGRQRQAAEATDYRAKLSQAATLIERYSWSPPPAERLPERQK